MSRLFPLFLSMLLVTVAMPATADPGGDGGDSWHEAVDVAEGAYNGTIGAGDAQDWYRITHPIGKGVSISLTMPNVGYYYLLVYSDEGHYISSWYLTPSYRGSVNVTTLAVGGGAVRVGIIDYDGGSPGVAYNLTLAVADLPDYAVETLEIRNVPVETDMATVADGTVRDITVKVANVGLGAGWGYLGLSATTVTDGRTSYIGHQYLELAPGETRLVKIRWDAKGFVGDVRITASATAMHDANSSNRELSKHHYVLVGGTGVGVSGAPAMGTCEGLVVYVCLYGFAGGSGAAAWGGVYAPYARAGALLYASPSYVYAGTGAGTLFTYVGVGAGHGVPYGGSVYACAYVLLGTCQGVGLP